MTIIDRPRRNRRTAAIRSLVRETRVMGEDLVLPLFVKEGRGLREPLASLPGQYRLSADEALRECERALSRRVHGVALFPVVPDSAKDSRAKESANPRGLAPETIRLIKERFPEIVLFADVAMDPYSSDGHDGLVVDGRIDNDATLPILCEQAVCLAQAGADYVAPSDMMDGRVGAIRLALDEAGRSDTGIMSYTAKYASCFYGPFREALDSAPRFGDKKTYQMDPANRREALREARLDLAEGADMVMVKPAGAYLDVIADLAASVDVPVTAYQVSGEYAMMHAAAKAGWLDLDRALVESLTAIKRAGAKLIFTYAALTVPL